MQPDAVLDLPRGRIYLVESAAKMLVEHAGAWVVTASHGGANAGRRAVQIGAGLAVFNDAGGGKEDAGIAALAVLQAAGIPCLTISHDTGRIGDVQDMWENGVISHANAAASALGLAPGQPVRAALTERLA
jgi:hypothetical protein